MCTVYEDSKWKSLTNRQYLRVFKIDPNTTLNQMLAFIKGVELPFAGEWKTTHYIGNEINELKIHAMLHKI